MNRASPAKLRAALASARELADAGILFVPMPVADDAEYQQRLLESGERLAQMADAADAEQRGWPC